MSYIDIALIVLVIAGIWAVCELALTLHRARKAVSEVVDNVNNTLEQAQPIVSKVDGVMDDLDPAIKQVPSLVDKVSGTIDVATVDLARVADILGDVSNVSGTVSNATSSVSKGVSRGVSTAVSGLSGAIKKLTNKQDDAQVVALEGADPAPELATGEKEAPQKKEALSEKQNTGYIVYPPKKEETTPKAATKSSASKRTSSKKSSTKKTSRSSRTSKAKGE